jgi:phospholipid-binding lipoprotein MlaA
MKSHFSKLVALLLLVGLASGCATTRLTTAPNTSDRFESWNRSVYSFNETLDRAVAKPVATAYATVTPKPVRSGLANFLSNIVYPAVILQDALQLKPTRFARDTGRLLVNTTVGIGGLFDPASQLGLEANNEDFGQTLGYWGVPSGPYLMLPVLGPSTVRDTVGTVADHFSQPESYLSSNALGWGISGTRLVDRRARLLGTEEALKRYLDPYAFIRNSYLQRREFLIYDGNPPEQPLVEEPDDETP